MNAVFCDHYLWIRIWEPPYVNGVFCPHRAAIDRRLTKIAHTTTATGPTRVATIALDQCLRNNKILVTHQCASRRQILREH